MACSIKSLLISYSFGKLFKIVIPESSEFSIYGYIVEAGKSNPPFGRFSSTSAASQVRQRLFPMAIFPLIQFPGFTGIENRRKPNRPQTAPAFSFLRYQQGD